MARATPQHLQAPGDALPRPHGDSYWVWPGRLLAGSHPLAHLDALRGAGVGSYIDLTHPPTPPAPYAASIGEAATWQGFPIVDYSVPGVALMRRILDAIDASIADGQVVYVHCHAGVGRTGTTVGCWLVEQGLAGDEALALIAAKRQVVSRLAFSPQSPETEAQRLFVRRWLPRAAGG